MEKVIVPLKGRVLIQKQKPEDKKTEGGIIIETASNAAPSNLAIVMAVGSEVESVSKGDTVIVSRIARAEDTPEDDLVVIREEEIVAIVN